MKQLELSMDEAIRLTEKAIDRLRYSDENINGDGKELKKWRAINMELRIIKELAELKPII